MVTTVANSLFDRLIEAFPPNRPYGRADIRKDPMPDSVAAYIEHLLEVKLEDLLASEPSEDAWIDVYTTEVKEAQSRYLDVLKKNQAIPAREWADALRTACHETVRFLARPAVTLSDAVFEKTSGSVHADAVFRTVDFYQDYPYFRNVIEAYFEQKGVVKIDRERFEGLVNRIDRQMTSDFSSEQWVRLLEPMTDLLRVAGLREIPVELLKTFLQEKGAEAPLRRLKRRYGLDGYVPIENLEVVFDRDVEMDAESSKSTEVRRAPERPASDRREDVREEPLPLWKQFERGHEHVPEAPEKRSAEEKRSADASRKEPSEPLWKQFRKPSDRASHGDGPPAGLTALEETVLGERGAKNRELFVKHLFKGRPEEYEATLKRLASAASWSQASQIIAQDVFLKHQVNIYSDPAVAFTDAAEAQYRA